MMSSRLIVRTTVLLCDKYLISYLACLTDSVDLSVARLSLATPVVESGSYTGVNLWLKVDLAGTRTLTPDSNQDVDVYKVQLFLSTDKVLSSIDKEVSVIPIA